MSVPMQKGNTPSKVEVNFVHCLRSFLFGDNDYNLLLRECCERNKTLIYTLNLLV